MSRAIQVKYIGPTNIRGARVKAFVSKNLTVTLFYDYSKSDDDNMLSVANKLIKKLDWPIKISGSGSLPNGDHVFTIALHD